MRAIDASSMIWAWDNYPIGQIPNLWAWLQTEVEAGELVIPSVALTEVNHKVPACGAWLHDNGCNVIQVTNVILQSALQTKTLLGIANDNYHAKGVDENDVLIVATAHTMGVELLSDENRQQNLPPDRRRYKIPAVCDLPQINVPCSKFVDFFKGSGQVV
jgi:hypothetical protein